MLKQRFTKSDLNIITILRYSPLHAQTPEQLKQTLVEVFEYKEEDLRVVINRALEDGVMVYDDCMGEWELYVLAHCDHDTIEECRTYGCKLQHPFPFND